VEPIKGQNLWNFDLQYFKTYKLVCGVDEVGRGSIAGPLVAAAVIFREPAFNCPANDSKALTPLKRKHLFFEIISLAYDFSFGIVSPLEMRTLSMHKVNLMAMERALRGLRTPPGVALLDGKWKIEGQFSFPQVAIIGGDRTSGSIASSSILAKVYRDKLMEILDKIFPQYSFVHHKGYATAEHYKAIKENGLTPEHRLNYPCLKEYEL